MCETLRSDDEENSAVNNKNPSADNHGGHVAPHEHPRIESTAYDAGCIVHGPCSGGQQLDGWSAESLAPEWFVDGVLKTEEETRLNWYVRESSDASHWKGDDDE